MANAVGLPPLLGYLVGGFTLFAFGMEGGELLGELAHYGVIFLLFALGLRIRLRDMVQPEVLGSSLLQFVISVALLTAVFTALGVAAGLELTGTIVTAILLGVASTVVAAKGLESGEYEALEKAGASSICHPLTEAGERLAEQILAVRSDSPAARVVGEALADPAPSGTL